MGKGSGSKAKTPVEHNDTITSSQMFSVIDVWGEGQIVGLVDGLKSVYLDGTAVVSDSGETNISGVSVETNVGTADQDYLDGFPQSASEIGVNVQVKKETPVIRTISDSRIDMLRVNLYSQGLYVVTNEGDTLETSLQLKVYMKESSSSEWIEKSDISFINQKSRNEFYFQAEIWDLPKSPFDVKVERLTSDAETGNWQAIQNKSFWRSYSIVINQKYRWPYTAYCGIKLDSKNFNGSIPKRNYLVDGMIVKVPSNYDPVRRIYNGFWDGSFKSAFTNNPAWVVYDLIKEERYGLGDKKIDVSESSLYIASQFCDELVDDGSGNLEPRFVCNCNITSQRKAWDLITDILSVFRGIPLYNGKSLSVSIDSKKDPKALYTNANVIDGEFIYGSSQLQDRHSVVEVTFIDKENNYEQAIEYVQSDSAIVDSGYNVKKVEAFATDTRSQARRFGLYILETEILESKTVSFRTGIAGLKHLPGDIIKIADSDYYGSQIGGRILSVSEDRKTIELDRQVQVENNSSVDYILSLVNDDGIPEEFSVNSVSEDLRKVTISTTCPDSVSRMSVWSMSFNNLGTKLYRCITISENDDRTYSVNAIEHVPEKTEIIDNGVVFDPEIDSLYGDKIPAPEGLAIESTPDSPKGQARVYFNSPQTARNVRFNIIIKLNNNVVYNVVISENEYYINVDKAGTYNVQVKAISTDGKSGEVAEAVFLVSAPPKPQSISWTTGNLTATLKPVLSPLRTLGEQYEWFFGSTEQEVLDMTYNLGFAYVLNKVDLRVNSYYWFGVRSVNNIGKSEITTVRVLTKFDSADLDDLINLALPKTEYIKEINENIEGLSELASLRVVDKNGGRPRVSGIYVNAGNAEQNLSSVVDFVADAVSISSPDNLERWVYFDSVNRKLVVAGDIRANAGVLNNVTINQNCVILGTLEANRIIGDFVQLGLSDFAIDRATSWITRYNGNPRFAMDVWVDVSWMANVKSGGVKGIIASITSDDGRKTQKSVSVVGVPSGRFYIKHQFPAGVGGQIGIYSDSFNQSAPNDTAGGTVSMFAAPTGRGGFNV